jgi:hypothetical protein
MCLRSEFCVVMSVTIYAYKRCTVRLYLQLFCRSVHVLFTLFIFVCHSDVQHILCCVFVLFFFALLPVSLNCPFLISPSVFSNVYLLSQGFLKNCRIFSFKRFFPEIYKRCEHIVEKYSVTSVQMMRAGSNNDNNFFYYILSSNKGIFV